VPCTLLQSWVTLSLQRLREDASPHTSSPSPTLATYRLPISSTRTSSPAPIGSLRGRERASSRVTCLKSRPTPRLRVLAPCQSSRRRMEDVQSRELAKAGTCCVHCRLMPCQNPGIGRLLIRIRAHGANNHGGVLSLDLGRHKIPCQCRQLHTLRDQCQCQVLPMQPGMTYNLKPCGTHLTQFQQCCRGFFSDPEFIRRTTSRSRIEGAALEHGVGFQECSRTSRTCH
jgi:hypothetical protein